MRAADAKESAVPAAQSALFDPSRRADLRRLQLRTRKRINTSLLGNYRAAFRGSGLVFSDLREYQPGDDVKHIHWKATARSGKVYVKSYEEDRSLNVIVAVDLSHSTICGAARPKRNKALEFAALISTLAAQSQDAAGICLFSDRIEHFLPPLRERAQLFRILSLLLWQPEREAKTDIAATLEYLRQEQRRRALIFVVSDFLAPPFEQELRYLALRHDVVCALVEDDLDIEIPASGLVVFREAEGSRRAVVDTRSAKHRLGEIHSARVRALSQRTEAAGADFMRIKDNPILPLAELMRRRARRMR